MAQLLALLVTLLLVKSSLQDINNNEVDDSPFVEAAEALFSESKPDLGGLVSNIIQSDGIKQLGEMFLGAQNAGATSQIMQGLGAMMNQGGGGGLDLATIGNVLSLLNVNQEPRGRKSGKGDAGADGFDFSSVLSFASSFMNQDGAADMLGYLPAIMDMFSAFYGPEADKIAHSHSDHSWYLPPMIEKIHVLADQFMNSKLGGDLVKKFGAESFIRIFTDENGRFSGRKFIDLLENHSFRRHWIEMVTSRLSLVLAHLAEPQNQKKYLTTGQFFLNNFLKSQGVPKSAQFDPKRPTESISALLNYLPKAYFNFNFDSTPYVAPAMDYIHDAVKMAEHKGFLGRAVDSGELTNKLTDTINMEMIEPVARVNRALRFAKKVPKCTQYVLCLANDIGPEEQLSLPGLKKFLSQSASLLGSWYISGNTNTPSSELYKIVRGGDCKSVFHEECHDFHLEEIKVTTEYVHNEL